MTYSGVTGVESVERGRKERDGGSSVSSPPVFHPRNSTANVPAALEKCLSLASCNTSTTLDPKSALANRPASSPMTRACTPSKSGDNRGSGSLKTRWIWDFLEFVGDMLNGSRLVCSSHDASPVTAFDSFPSEIPLLRFALSIVDLGNTIVHDSCKLDWRNFQGGKEGRSRVVCRN